MKRILMVLTVALVVVGMVVVMAMPAFARHAQSGPQGTGQTVTHQGNSTHSPVISCHHGAPGSSGSAC